ncbi:head GIN domain-containing protein [Chitinophaga sp. HK235]|uniref:head GIN domain-containing protein n=1 Tax=Chitinophaga sp. HK235 TaxID=2952571 RepID=UPI001BA5791B|nr:head GIN domain-containing protein [Chitinophaga sp. HK235]
MKKQAIITYTSLSVSWLLLMLVIFTLILSSCTRDHIAGSGHVVAETRNISPFTEVEISGPFEVHLIQDSTAAVEIKAEDNIIGAIETGTHSNTLFIRLKNHVFLQRHLPIQVYVHSRQYQSINFAGSGHLDNKDTLQASIFSYQIDGSADAALTLAVQKLNAEINGSGNLEVKGNAAALKSDINGSGHIGAMDLDTQQADITIRGSGDHAVKVKNELYVGIYGSGNVTYSGNPGRVETDIKGSGKVRKI